MPLKFATWNVNSIRVRVTHLIAWLEKNKIDVIGLQEIKCEEASFPLEALKEIGYNALVHGQKTYNGVAILSKLPFEPVALTGYFLEHEQKRVVACFIEDILFINIYVPNGQSVGSEKYFYKLTWFSELIAWVKKIKKTTNKIIICGDFNIAPEPIDNPEDIEDQIMISKKEREGFKELIDLGFTDALRYFHKEPKIYTWWDYRIRAFQRNLGYRIDHFLVSDTLLVDCKACVVDKEPRKLEKPSDHAPVILEFQ